MQISTEDKWLLFSNKIIPIKHIDYFEIEAGENKNIVICGYHVGQSYEHLIEEYSSNKNLYKRIDEIKYLLGMINVEL